MRLWILRQIIKYKKFDLKNGGRVWAYLDFDYNYVICDDVGRVGNLNFLDAILVILSWSGAPWRIKKPSRVKC